MQSIHSTFWQKSVSLWERDYKLFIQAVRNSLALILVAVFSVIFKNDSSLWMGLCVLGLMQSNVGSPFWRFEYNLILTFCVSSAGLMLGCLFLSSPFLLVVYAFFLAFLVFIAVYFKLNTIYSVWTWIIVQYGVLSEKSFDDGMQNVLFNFYALLVCLFICGVILRPKIKKECLYEMKATLNGLSQYLVAFKKDIFLNTQKSRDSFLEERAAVFARLQSLDTQIKDIQSLLKKGKNSTETESLFLMATLKERLVEIVISALIDIRLLDVDMEKKNEAISVLNEIIFLDMKMTGKKKIFSCKEISAFYRQLTYRMNEKINSIEKKSQKEILLLYSKMQFNVNLLNAEIDRYVSHKL